MTANPAPLDMNSTSNVDPAQLLRLAMRRMAATVCVVSCLDSEGAPQAMTATSVTSLSLEPPSLLACINQWAKVHDSIQSGQPFCINILDQSQQDIAEQCSKPNQLASETLLQAPWQQGPHGLPYLAKCQAAVFCSLEQSIKYTTHSIFIGLVESVHLSEQISPLVYMDGNYQSLFASASEAKETK